MCIEHQLLAKLGLECQDENSASNKGTLKPEREVLCVLRAAAEKNQSGR